MVTEAAPNVLDRVRNKAHPNCIVCGLANERGLRVAFALTDDGAVQACFDCDKAYEGFPGVLHGGTLSSLLDGAMTNCLFAHGHNGITGELKIRFRHPVITDRVATVRAWIERTSPPYHILKAEVIQDERVKATATGKFVDQPRFGAKNECPGVC